MPATKKQHRSKPKSLAHSRPRVPSTKPGASLSSKATRALIRSHHVLEKRKAKAVAAGDEITVAKIEKEIEKHGGIEMYQRASLLGQAKERGGDSSKILMNWLRAPSQLSNTNNGSQQTMRKAPSRSLRMLEVGALSTNNACSRSGMLEIERIDLNSQAEGILQQDFMERPLPTGTGEEFDIISLSLVLNYVPDAAGRGEMLERTLRFLRLPSLKEEHYWRDFLPSLFLVLPISCVTNSRYLDEAKLEAIMRSLGYTKMQQKLSNKLAYYLWRATDLTPKKRRQTYAKVEVRSGKSRNNFAITLK